MNGFADDPLISTLFDQPVLLWSLAISASIFVIAIGLGAIFKLRNRAKFQQAQRDSLDEPTERDSIGEALRELNGNTADLANPSKLDVNNGQSADRENTLVSGTGGERAVETAVSGDESGTPAQIVEVADVKDDENSESEESDSSKSALADIFEDEVVVDPHLQAMRDNLPDITISKLQEEAHSIISQLQERNAAFSIQSE